MNTVISKAFFLTLLTMTGNAFSQNYKTFLALVELNGKHGCINVQGQEVIPVTWDEMGFWGNNLIAVNKGAKGKDFIKKGGKWGYCDKQGKLKIPLQFDEAETFHEGMAAVRSKGKWGFIDTTGKLIIAPQYNRVRIFKEGFCAVAKGKKWGFIDATGREVVKFEYGELSEFKNGIAKAFVGERSEDGWEESPGAGYCLINKKGERLFEPKYKSIGEFRDGLAPAEVAKEGNSFDTKQGFINEKGELVIPAVYDDAQEFVEGMAIVGNREKNRGGDGYAYGVINIKGEEIVKPQYDRITMFDNGKAVVQKGWQGSSFITETDTRDNSIINHESFPKCALIDKQGNFILNFDWRNMYPVDNDLFIASRAKYNGTGVINSKGETILPFEYVNLQGAGNDLFIAVTRFEVNSEYVVVDKNNKVLFKTNTHFIQRFTYDVGVLLLRLNKGHKSGLVNINGEIIFKDKYDSISDFYLTE